MDLSFSFERMSRVATPVAADIRPLLASLAAEQALSPTSVAAMRAWPSRAAAEDPRSALVSLFSGADGWAIAAAALGGSFHPRIASAAAGKAGSTLMKPGFTFAF